MLNIFVIFMIKTQESLQYPQQILILIESSLRKHSNLNICIHVQSL